MRVHADKILRRREGVVNLKHYQNARELLTEDFSEMCGYCGKSRVIMRQRFHIDHFVPVTVDKDRENDYYNLVLACPKCNLSKSNKWPTKNKTIPNNGTDGFVDPATAEYEKHVERNKEGYVVGITPLGKNMCKLLNLDIRRSDLYWKIAKIYEQQEQLEELFNKGELSEREKDYYIKINIFLKKYMKEAFEKGE